MKIKEAYYYFYYTIYKAWSKNYNPLLTNRFKADICITVLQIWMIIALYAYMSIFLGVRIELSIGQPLGFIPFLLAFCTTLYFFTFSNKWKSSFEEFEKWPKKKKRIGSLIVWCVVIFILFNLVFSVKLMNEIILI
ncbi:hypothetical protein [Pedobacter nototheniae]|uniref:hypothetical protein n=1 Tax=Pedobacter nototheniae TaxID=2488994 RepID=UPI00103A910F|nr:hypothetical protein [Pedobacter nototheniae]